jgi:hypothetical protein
MAAATKTKNAAVGQVQAIQLRSAQAKSITAS